MDIQTILSASKQDLLRGNRYKIAVTNPATGSLDQPSTINCQHVDFPGSTFGSYDRRQKGPLHRLPNDKIFPEVNIGFYVDGNATVRKYFQGWHDFIYTDSNQFRFFDEYKGNVQIQEMNRQGSVAQTAQLIDCYPISITPVNLSYDNSNQAEILEVTLQCHTTKIT